MGGGNGGEGGGGVGFGGVVVGGGLGSNFGFCRWAGEHHSLLPQFSPAAFHFFHGWDGMAPTSACMPRPGRGGTGGVPPLTKTREGSGCGFLCATASGSLFLQRPTDR